MRFLSESKNGPICALKRPRHFLASDEKKGKTYQLVELVELYHTVRMKPDHQYIFVSTYTQIS
jgi:hypothetical protein